MSERPIEVVVALIVKDGSVLMGERRPEKIYPLHWEFPGGKVEPNETPLEALKREIREELTIEIESAKIWDTEVATYTNGITYSISYFIVREWKFEIEDREFNRVAWISRDEMPTLVHLTGNAKVIGRLLEEWLPQ